MAGGVTARSEGRRGGGSASARVVKKPSPGTNVAGRQRAVHHARVPDSKTTRQVLLLLLLFVGGDLWAEPWTRTSVAPGPVAGAFVT